MEDDSQSEVAATPPPPSPINVDDVGKAVPDYPAQLKTDVPIEQPVEKEEEQSICIDEEVANAIIMDEDPPISQPPTPEPEPTEEPQQTTEEEEAVQEEDPPSPEQQEEPEEADVEEPLLGAGSKVPEEVLADVEQAHAEEEGVAQEEPEESAEVEPKERLPRKDCEYERRRQRVNERMLESYGVPHYPGPFSLFLSSITLDELRQNYE